MKFLTQNSENQVVIPDASSYSRQHFEADLSHRGVHQPPIPDTVLWFVLVYFFFPITLLSNILAGNISH